VAGGGRTDGDKMAKCVWVSPEVVARFEFLEWTDSEHVRHLRYVGLRDDKEPRTVIRVTSIVSR
jgi:ATP-dependent DNA ligase